MTVYVAMIHDRHIDPEPYLFSAVEAAVAFARHLAHEWACGGDVEEDEPPPAGWLYHATYSVEGDSVWVLAKEIDERLVARPS